ncbi:FAD binding domain-containing protein [Lyophyllum atratum]|nr:FAD binding domain-containing protein [Lyophyllum atratum]
MSNTSPKVLIVGGGPSGLICALSLLRNGVSVRSIRIIEKSVHPRLGQRGAGIMPRSLEMFDSLGLDNIFKLAIPAPPIRRYDFPKGTTPIHEFELAPRIEPTPTFQHLNIVLLGQNRLEEVIRAALTEYSCQVELGTELVSLEQSEHGVLVKLLKRGSGKDETGTAESVRYDWVIGADGARGVVRKQSTLTFDGETRDVEKLVVGDIYLEGLSQKYWHMWGEAADVLISLRPTDTANLFNFIIGGNVDHIRLPSDEDALKKFLVDNVGSETELKLGDVPWLSGFTPNIRMVKTFQQGRVFLVGDAGHVHSPAGGQGMNSGVQDSFNLGWKLALVLRNLAPASLLQTYSEERIPVIKEMLDRTTEIQKRTFTEKGDAPWARSGGLLQLGINYRWSSLVVDERRAQTSKLRHLEKEILNAYGEQATGRPDASDMVDLSTTPHSTGRLFKIFGPAYHTVLMFTSAHEQCAILIQSLSQYPQGTVRSAVIVRRGHAVPTQCQGAGIVLEDLGGHAHEAYGAENGWGLVIVGAIVSGLAGLHKYFEGIFGLHT